MTSKDHAKKIGEAMTAAAFVNDEEIWSKLPDSEKKHHAQILAYAFREMQKIVQLITSIDQFKTTSVEAARNHLEIYEND